MLPERPKFSAAPLCAAALLCALLFPVSLWAAAAPDVPVLQDGVPLQDAIPDIPTRLKQYTFKPPEQCVIEMTMQVSPGPRQTFPPFAVQIMRDRRLLFDYRLDDNIPNYLFFPVLDKGAYDVLVRGPGVGSPYTLQLRRIAVKVTEQDTAGALAAIQKGTANLASVSPVQARSVAAYAPAIESLVMAALNSDPGHANEQVVERDYLPWLKGQLQAVPEVQWNNLPVAGVARGNSAMYNTAIATLALAEMAPRNADAKTLAELGARFILAAQLTDRRPNVWRAALKSNPSFGGWRYTPQAADADLSVSGWCIIALNACAVAGIQPEGMREALDDALKFVRKTEAKDGFGYQIGGSGGAGPIRDAIGGLVFQLYGEHSPENDRGMAFLDRHLFGGTQTDDLDMNYPLYYAYYATRLHYLRGGVPWEAWRMTTIRQLVKLQQADGSWPALGKESPAGPQRYSTALSILILRMCLNDQPAYMTQEVRGF